MKADEKNFIKIGNYFIDIVSCNSFKIFKPNNDDVYLIAEFFFKGTMRSVKCPIKDKNELSFFLLQLERYFKDPSLLESITKLINEFDINSNRNGRDFRKI